MDPVFNPNCGRLPISTSSGFPYLFSYLFIYLFILFPDPVPLHLKPPSTTSVCMCLGRPLTESISNIVLYYGEYRHN